MSQIIKEAEEQLNSINEEAASIDSRLDNANDYEQAYAEQVAATGLTDEQFATVAEDVINGVKPDHYLPSLLSWLVEARLSDKNIKFRSLSKYTRTVNYKNGNVTIFYNDYSPANSEEPQNDVEMKDFNPQRDFVARETYFTDRLLHKKIGIYDTVVNGATPTQGFLFALINNVDKRLARPMAEQMYAHKLRLIASPYKVLNWEDNETRTQEGIVFNELPFEADKTIEFTDLADLSVQLNNFVDGLTEVSRHQLDELPEAVKKLWSVKGHKEDFLREITKSSLRLIVSNQYKNDVAFNLRAGTYQLAEVALSIDPKQTDNFDYKKTFKDFGKVDMVEKAGEYNFILMVPHTFETMVKFNASKAVPVPKLYTVYDRWDEYGFNFNKETTAGERNSTFYLRIKAKKKAAK